MTQQHQRPQSMRIAQVAPLYETVPPLYYAGTERVAAYLTEELVTAGHDVTLYASEGSRTKARLAASPYHSDRSNPTSALRLAAELQMLEQVYKDADTFDIIHLHIDFLPCSHIRRHLKNRAVLTMHGRLDTPDIRHFYAEFSDLPMASISNAQRAPLPQNNWLGTVYHGLPQDLYSLQQSPGQYLAFLGRLTPEKGITPAVQIARIAGMELRIAGRVGMEDQEYFQNHVRTLLHDPLVNFIGEVNDREKNDFLGNARALLFPINWPEPFGLVMIEAMACGTPVIAFRHGSVSEVIDDGVTGFIVTNIGEAVAALSKLDTLDRKTIRRTFEERFTSKHMSDAYLRLYHALRI